MKSGWETKSAKNLLKTGRLSLEPVDISGEEIPGVKKCSRRDFVRYGAGITLALIPLLGCGNAFEQGEDSPNTGEEANPRLSFEIRFSEPMNRESVEGAVAIAPASAILLSGDYLWSEGDTLLYYETEVDLEREYTVTIGSLAADINGNFLDGDEDGTGGDPYVFTVNGVRG